MVKQDDGVEAVREHEGRWQPDDLAPPTDMSTY